MSLSAYAQDLSFDPEHSKGQLYEYASFINVESTKFSVNEIIADKDLNFQPLEFDNQSMGFTTDNYWIHFKLKNSSDHEAIYYLETARPITDLASLHQVSANGVETFKSGDQITFADRQVKHRLTIFKITLPQNADQDFYLNLESDGETINVPLILYSPSEFWMVNYKQQLFLGLFYGVLFLGGIIYLFFYFSLRDKTFLYYGLYVFSIGFMQASLDGLIHQYMLPFGGFFNSRAVLITALLSTFFLLKYCEYFLKVNTLLPNFKKVYLAIYIVVGLLMLMVFISPKTLEFSYPLSNLNGLFGLLLILATVFTMRHKQISIDPYFSFGIFFLIIGLLGFVMNNLSLLPNNFFTLNSAKFGTGLEVLFLSLSMTNLIRKLRLNNEHAQEVALKKSEEISELKSYFMSNISHELRTPINAIMGVAELELKEANATARSRKHYQIIKNASLSLLSNVNDIIDFEKIEKNNLVLKSEAFNPSEILKQISDNWKAEAKQKGLHYSFEMDQDIPTLVNGDVERFVQIINNVLSNAVKFTEKGQITFKLKCLMQPNDICRFSIKISDTGIGMDDDLKNYAFDSFSQMRLDHKRKFGGIGLGLSISKYLVKRYKGTISIESTKDKGTDVFIELPLKYITPTEVPAQLFQNLLPQHVLVVEDNKINQLVMKKLLEKTNYISFSIVNNGQEAITALQEQVFDMVLMDLQMPIMDGYEATKIIRSGELGAMIRSIPIIAVTADAMQETKKRVIELGMNDYMTKPISRELLLQKMAACTPNPNLKIA